MKRIKLASLSLLAILCGMLVSCEKPVNNDYCEYPFEGGYLVLNNGLWMMNNASISMYNTASNVCTGEVFKNANDQALGDLGQDMIKVGDKFYISVYGSKVVFVTDNALKIIKVVKAEAIIDALRTELSPRYLCDAPDYVYVSYYEGYLGRISKESYDVEIVAVGPNPEGVLYNDGKIYVANSGALQNTLGRSLSVVDATSFAEEKRIEVDYGPCYLAINKSKSLLYVLHSGNYADIPPCLRMVDLATGEMTSQVYENILAMAMVAGDKLVMANSVVESWNPYTCRVTLECLNAADGSSQGAFTDDVYYDFFSLSGSTSSELLFLGAGNYQSTGTINIYDSVKKEKLKSFDSMGIYPQKVLIY